MLEKLTDMIRLEEARGLTEWGRADKTPQDLMIAVQEEIGEVAHAINHYEGSAQVQQEIAEVVGILSRLFSMMETE